MTDEEGQPLGELVQEYVRLKGTRGCPPERANSIGQDLGRALRSRIDVLGIDGERLLDVAQSEVLQNLEELEKQAALEDSGMLEQASRSRLNTETTWRSERKPAFASGPRNQASRRRIR